MANPDFYPNQPGWRDRLRDKLELIFEQRWLNLGLLGKMSALVIIGSIGLIGIFALLGISSARQTTQQALNERMKFARLTAELLDTALINISYTLERVAQNPLLAEADQKQQEIVDFLDSAAISDYGIHLLDLNGNAILNTDFVSHPEIIWTQNLSVIHALAGQNEQNISVLLDTRPWMIVATPVRDATGKVIGALTAVIDLTNTRIFPSQVSFGLGDTGTLDILDRSGFIIHSSRQGRVMQREEESMILQRLFDSEEGGADTCLGCIYNLQAETVDQVIAFAPLKHAAWGVVIRQDTMEAFAPVRRLMLQNFAMGALAIIGALTMVWLTTNSVIKPTQAVTEAARRIANGDFSTPLKHQAMDWPFRRLRRHDEIGELINNFDLMRAHLKQSIDEIHSLNRDLDQRVQERTQEALSAQLEAQSTRDDLRAIIDALDDELVVINVDDLKIKQLNKAAQKHHITDGANPIGDYCYDVFHEEKPCHLPYCECPLPLILERKESVHITQVRRDLNTNEERYLDIVASPLYDTQGKVTRIVELIRDVSEEKKIKESLVRKNQQLSTLNSIANTVNQSLNLTEILERALAEVLRLTGIDVGAIFLLKDSMGELDLMAHQGFTEEAAQLAAQLGMLDGSCGGVIERGQVAVVPDIARFRGRRAKSLKKEHLSSLMHVPLTAKGCTLGSMCVATRNKHLFKEEEQELLTSIGSQIAVAIENARLYAEVQNKEHIRGVLFNKLVNAQEEERRRIARELHDDTSQSLTALIFAAEESLEIEDIQHIKQKLKNMRDIIQRSLDGVHQIIFDLRPSMLDHLGLIPALRWFAQSRLEPKGVRVGIQQTTPIRRLSPELETSLFRVVQEAITNIARHAAARNVTLQIGFYDDSVSVEIRDDGIGFEINEITISPDSGRGLGLLGMEERLELLNGTLTIETSPGSGTLLHIIVPVNGRKTAHV